MTSESISILAVVCFVAMVSPGPDFVLITRNSLFYSRAHALASAAGVVLGCLIHATYCILGLAVVLAESVVVFRAIQYLGAAYLVYIGIRSLFSRSEAVETQPRRDTSKRTLLRSFSEGFLCNLLNPKLALFLLSLFTQFISVDATLWQKLVVAAVFVGESMIYWPLLVLLIQSPLVRERMATYRAGLERATGGLFVLLGLRIALED